jgi:hypothetical protein
MRGLLLGVGALALAIAYALWRDDSSWGLFIAAFLTMWGLTSIAWGLVTGWYDSAAACTVGCLVAAAAIVWAIVSLPAWGAAAVTCALCAAPAAVLGAARAWQLLGRAG